MNTRKTNKSPEKDSERNAGVSVVIFIIFLVLMILFALLNTLKIYEIRGLERNLSAQQEQIANLQNLNYRLTVDLNNCLNNYQLSTQPVSGSYGTGGQVDIGSAESSLFTPITEERRIEPKAPTPPKPRTVVQDAPSPRPAPAPVTQTVVDRPPQPQETKLVFPSYFYEKGSKEVKLCVRVDGRSDGHLPHLAIIDGRIDPNDSGIMANSDNGYDWVIYDCLPDFVGDWGAVRSGNTYTFFVSKRLVDLYLSGPGGKVEINSPATRNVYREMKEFGDYYIYTVL